MGTSPLRTVSAVQALADEVRDLILDGVLVPGEPLREVEWAERYAVGRQTFRSAAQLLCHQGLLVKRANRSFSVPDLDTADIADLFRTRLVLELAAVRMVTASSEVPNPAVQAVDDMAALPDEAPWRAVVDADQRFHRALIGAAGSPRLVRAYQAVESEVVLSMVVRPQYSRREHAAEHAELLDLVTSGDVAAAERGFIEHLRIAEANVLNAYAKRQEVPKALFVRAS